jgi:hypothetical protein
MIENLIVVGDLHLQESEPKRTQTQLFLDWLFQQDFNKNTNQILFLGDLVESVFCVHELLEIFIDYFLNKSHFDRIFILQGNHDSAIDTTLLSLFRPLSNVSIILEATELTIGATSFLFLPNFKHEGKGIKSMREHYEALTGKYDFCLHHIMDHTRAIDKSSIDLSKLSIGQYLCGHDHIEDVSKGGHYLGSPVLNSSSETGKDCIIASISVNTKKHTLIPVPKFLEYYTVTYPQDLPSFSTPLALLTVLGSVDRFETEKFYQEKARNIFTLKGFGFRAIYSKEIKQEDMDTLMQGEAVKHTDEEYFNQYAKVNKVSPIVQAICLEVIKKAERE